MVPVSLIGTFAAMYLCGFSLNNLSLMALTIATGFVVDDAIVVLENIARHLEAGMKPLQAALQGTREVGFTVLSMSLSLVAVFLPLLLMGGLPGRLLREFAVTLSVGDVFTEVTHFYPDLTVHLTLFDAAIASGTPQMLEHHDIRWITPAEINAFEFCPADIEILQKIKNRV